MKRNLLIGASFLVLLLALSVAEVSLEKTADAQAKGAVMAPRYEVDPFWPKTLPNKWHIGLTIGVGIDAQDKVWIIHRNNQLSDSEVGSEGAAAPPVLAFDPAGNVVQSWGGPDAQNRYQWPESNHGITIDHKGNVWIGGNGGPDSHVLKFTQSGQFISQFGRSGANISANPQGLGSNDPENFGRVAKITIDAKANEAYLADGYLNKRVAIIDMDTGKMKRFWGAYGNKPSDENMGGYDPDLPLIQQFRSPVHCADVSNDGLVYVCDRPNDRIQVFTKEGKFVSEKRIAPRTRGDGSTWDIAFSKDAEQKYMFVADGKNERI